MQFLPSLPHYLLKAKDNAEDLEEIALRLSNLYLEQERFDEVLRHTVVNGDSLSNEVTMETIGHNLMTADKYGYVLPFEFISVFLLACIIGGLVILNNKKKEESK